MNSSDESKQDVSPLSFESLQAELGDLPPPVVETDEEMAMPLEEVPALHENEAHVEPIPQQQIRMEALTGSSPQRRPLWVDALFCILFALALVTLVTFKTGFASFQPWISRFAIMLALGGAGWAYLGLRTASSLAGKRFTWGVVAAGLIVALMAFMVRMP